MNTRRLFFIICSFLVTYSIQSADTITVFIHGTCMAPRITQLSRLQQFFEAPQGMSLAADLPSYYRFCETGLIAAQKAPELFSLQTFYIYRWPGHIVSHEHRMQVAFDLKVQLHRLAEQFYAMHGFMPKIRLIGFSHGGNVILNLAAYGPLVVAGKTIVYDIWLMGTPVLQCNKEYIASPVFGGKYLVYTKNDRVQRLDPQNFQIATWFSYKIFSEQCFATNDHCIHVNMEFLDGYTCGHIKFGWMLQAYLADIITMVLAQYKQHKLRHFTIQLPLPKSYFQSFYKEMVSKIARPGYSSAQFFAPK